jgi:vacuolar-type H+-ATPase subunit H
LVKVYKAHDVENIYFEKSIVESNDNDTVESNDTVIFANGDFIVAEAKRVAESIKDNSFLQARNIILEAQKEANDIIKSTEDKIISMINENEITKRAKEQAEEIISNANKRSKEIKQGTRQYADDVLSDMEKIMLLSNY